MKAMAWLCSMLTLLCASRLACTAQRGYLDYSVMNSPSMMQDDFLMEKRTKPSLSIVNPLDVLRQRLLLEIARRQMKENTRQVEINRAILKNVGKRGPEAQSDVGLLNTVLYKMLQGDDFKDDNMKNFDITKQNPPANEIDVADDYALQYIYGLHKNRYNTE